VTDLPFIVIVVLLISCHQCNKVYDSLSLSLSFFVPVFSEFNILCLYLRHLIRYIAFQIFLHICSFLEAPTLIRCLSLVCKQFHLILKDEFFWKTRINHMWPDSSGPILRPG